MNLNWQVILTLFLTEFRMVLRDRRILITSILLPLLVTPMLFLASSWSVKKREKVLQEAAIKLAVTGSAAQLARDLMADVLKLPAGQTNHDGSTRPTLEVASVTNALEALHRGDIDLAIESLSAAEAKAKTNSAPGAGLKKDTAETGGPEAKIAAATPLIRIIFRGDRDTSSSAAHRFAGALEEVKKLRQGRLLEAKQFPIKPPEAARITNIDLASKGQVAGLTLGRVVTLFVLVFIMMGGTVVATDSLAGEKERGTLETLLTTSVQRIEVLVAKSLVIVALGVIITLLQAANLLVYVGFKLLPVPVNLAAAVTPFSAALLVLLFVPIAALLANILLLVSGLSRSYKEAQLYFFPVFLLALVPALAAMLPGLSLRSVIVAIPIANLSLAIREILIGIYDWPMILLAWVVTAATAAWTARLGVRVLSSERLISATETDAAQFSGGPALFERHVLRWFVMLWAVLIMVSNYTQSMDVRVQLVINLVGLFFGATCLILWKYRLNPVEALALRKPHPAVWLATLVGVPGGLIVATGSFRLTSSIFPAPEKLLQEFEKSLLPEGVPVAQLLIFMTVLPGIFEELAFRGVLLHGLRRRLHPALLALAVGVFFGVFHVALFRFVPTATLGVVFACMTMLTGSIYPVMVWHALSNGLGVLLHLYGMPLTELDAAGHTAGVGSLAAAFYITWRHRTPYPGLKKWSGSGA